MEPVHTLKYMYILQQDMGLSGVIKLSSLFAMVRAIQHGHNRKESRSKIMGLNWRHKTGTPSAQVSTAELVEPAFQDAKSIIATLVDMNSTTSANPELAHDTRQVSDYATRYLASLGATILKGKPYEFPAGSGKMHTSVLAVFAPNDPNKRNKKALMFSAHLDTVPALEDWDGKDPYKAQQMKDKIVGRGAIDLKGPAGTVMAGIKAMKDHGRLDNLQRPLVVALSSCEEVGLHGAEQISKMLKEQHIKPEEIMIVEASEGYVGTGFKGGWQKALHFVENTDPGHGVWPHYMRVKLSASGGHSSIQGGSAADPAYVAANKVLAMVEGWREKGLSAEICQVDYGKTSNVVGGELELMIGYDGHEETLRKLQDEMVLGLDHYSTQNNFKLKVLGNGLTNFVLKHVKHEVSGLDYGQLGVKVEYNVTPEQEHHKHLVQMGRKSESVAEAVLRTARAVYAKNKEQKGAKTEGYVLPPMGVTKLSVPIMHASDTSGEMIFDMRYPMEAVKGNATMESAHTVSKAVEEAAGLSAPAGVQVVEVSHWPPYVSHAFNPSKTDAQRQTSEAKLKEYVSLARKTGMLKHNSGTTHLPAGSDGNVFAKAFPETDIFNVSAGGFKQNVHGKNEHITHAQIKQNLAFYMETIHQKCCIAQHQQHQRS